MDATRKSTRASAWACALIAITGCTWDLLPPTAHQEQPPANETKEPPQIVRDGPATQPAAPEDEIAGGVQNFIRRIETSQRAADRRFTWSPRGTGQTQQAADVEAAPPKTAGPGSVTLIPAHKTGNAPTEESTGPGTLSTKPPAQEPPALASVAVRAAPDFTVQPGEPDTPGVNAATVARTAPSSLRQFLDQAVSPAEGSFREQLDLRLLRATAGDYDRAREPLKLVTAQQQELATRFVEAWIAIREGESTGDAASGAASAAQQLAELQEALRRLSDLSIPVLTICSAVRGFGQYDALDPPRFLAGGPGEFVLYCEVRDFVSERRKDDLYYTTFDLTTTILNRAGDAVVELKDSEITDRCRNRRHDCFIPRLVRLPATLSPGQYVAKVTVIDKLGQKVAESRAPFQLVARP